MNSGVNNVTDSEQSTLSSHRKYNQLAKSISAIKRPFIHSGYLNSAPSRNLLRGVLSPATAKEKCLKKLAEGRHIVLGQ